MKKIINTQAILFILFFSVKCFSQYTYGWIELHTGISDEFWSLSAVDSNIVWVSCDNLKILKTTNGGNNWIVLTVGQSNKDEVFPIYNIFASDDNNAICTGSTNTYTKVFKTTNGGNNWITVFTQQGGFIDNIYMFSNTNGFMNGDPVGGRVSFWKTTNGGYNWDSTGLYYQTLPDDYGICNSFFVGENRAWFGTLYGNIYYSTNYGNSWTKLNGGSYANIIWSNNPASGFIFRSGGYSLLYSKNFGFSWMSNPVNPGNDSNLIMGIAGFNDELWLTRNDNDIYYSSDNGNSWINQYTSNNLNFKYLTKSRSDNTLWAIKESESILKYGLISGVSTISHSVPETFKLYQNYPNPFNPVTKIKFDIKENSNVLLKIFDINGKEITTLVNNKLSTGTYSVDFNASHLSSGVYFCVLKTNNCSSVKKMALVK